MHCSSGPPTARAASPSPSASASTTTASSATRKLGAEPRCRSSGRSCSACISASSLARCRSSLTRSSGGSTSTWRARPRSRPPRRKMTSNRRLFLDARTARVAWTVLVFIGALGLAYALRNVFVLVVMSLFFAFLLFPLVRLTQRVIQHRLSAIAAVYLVVLATLGGAGIAVGPRLGTEARNLVQQLPEASKRIQNGELVVGVLARTGWERGQIRAIDRILQTHMGTIVGYAQHTAANGLKWLAGGWMVLLIPVFAFFILKDSERLTSVVIWRLGSDARRGMWWGLAEDLSLLLGQYVRALVLLALITFVAW